MRDKFATDGIISHGERIVRRGGKVLFGGWSATSEALLGHVGKRVWVMVDDYFFSDVVVCDVRDYTIVICTAPLIPRPKRKP